MKRFSMIIPIYNTQDYLVEALDSVIHQTLPFEENIEMILLDDGSEDESPMICRKYADQYPDNITFFSQSNQGVSSARNKALSLATAEYVLFMDSDDKLDSSFLAEYKDLVDKHPEISIAVAPIQYFDAKDELHPLNGKFDGRETVDITQSPQDIVSLIGGSLVKKEILKKEPFNTNLPFGEDIDFVIRTMLDAGSYGMIKDSFYYYRKRSDGSSAVQQSRRKAERFTLYFKEFCQKLINDYENNSGEIPPFLQNCFIDIIYHRIQSGSPNEEYISNSVSDSFFAFMQTFIHKINDQQIHTTTILNSTFKAFMLRLKHGMDIPAEVKIDKKSAFACILGYPLSNLKNFAICLYEFCPEPEYVTIKFKMRTLFPVHCLQLYALNNGEKYKMDVIPYDEWDTYSLNRVIRKGYMLSVRIPLGKKAAKVSFAVEIENVSKPVKMNFSYRTGLVINAKEVTSKIYSVVDNIMVYKKDIKKTNEKEDVFAIVISRYSFRRHIRLERVFWRYKESENQRLRFATKAKRFYYMYKARKSLPLKKLFFDYWQIGNGLAGQAFMENQDENNCFVISSLSSDYQRLKKYGDVVDYNSPAFIHYVLNANQLVYSDVITTAKDIVETERIADYAGITRFEYRRI